MESFVSNYWAVFGIFSIVGGIIGWVKAKSMASLIAGSVSGLTLLSAFIFSKSNPMLGTGLGLTISLLLFGRFLGAYLKSRKPFPALPMIALGGVGIAGGLLILVRGF